MGGTVQLCYPPTALAFLSLITSESILFYQLFLTQKKKHFPYTLIVFCTNSFYSKFSYLPSYSLPSFTFTFPKTSSEIFWAPLSSPWLVVCSRCSHCPESSSYHPPQATDSICISNLLLISPLPPISLLILFWSIFLIFITACFQTPPPPSSSYTHTHTRPLSSPSVFPFPITSVSYTIIF